MNPRTITVDDRTSVCTITVNRPEVMNAINAQVIDDLHQEFARLADRADLRCVILTGAGDKAFAAGADIAHMTEMTSEEASRFAHAGHVMARVMADLPVPIIAAVNGFALGGGLELALCADFMYAARSSKLGLPEVTLGVVPGFGGMRRLVQRVGIAHARELVMSGKVIDAEEALRIGLVNQIVDPADLMATVGGVAERIARNGPLAVARARQALLQGDDLSLDAALALEQEHFAALFATEDQKEGMRAFVAKRKPVFQGR